MRGFVLTLLIVCLAALPAAERCHAAVIDSLSCRRTGGSVEASFLLDARQLAGADLQQGLEGRGLRVECVVALSVIKRGGLFGDDKVLADRLSRTMTYSRMHREFSIADNGEEVFYSESFYEALDHFRRFVSVPLVNTAKLEPGGVYIVELELELRLALPPGNAAPAGGLGVDTLRREVSKIFASDEPLLSDTKRSVDFSPDRVPAELFTGLVPCGFSRAAELASSIQERSPTLVRSPHTQPSSG